MAESVFLFGVSGQSLDTHGVSDRGSVEETDFCWLLQRFPFQGLACCKRENFMSFANIVVGTGIVYDVPQKPISTIFPIWPYISCPISSVLLQLCLTLVGALSCCGVIGLRVWGRSDRDLPFCTKGGC